mmetsp:Transcript_24899/g.59102  ORF Transcript_24899/g.59102 Transcript_24899/m.59102 type:complete len:94 (+) Transcript_24899:2851-3132(+)
MIVLPSSRASLSRIFISATALVESSPLVGSSSNRIEGSVSNSLPILTRFFSPPEIWKIGVSWHLVSRSCLMILSTSPVFLDLGHFEGRRKSAV